MHCKFFSSLPHLFVDNQLDILQAPELTVHVQEQLRLDVCRLNAVLVISPLVIAWPAVLKDWSDMLHACNKKSISRYCKSLVDSVS